MSIWTDMLKYNAKKKILSSANATSSIVLNFDNTTLDTNYKTIGEFLPMVSGNVSIYFDLERNWTGSAIRQDDTIIQIFNYTDNFVVSEIKTNSSVASALIEIELGKRYLIRSKIAIAAGDTIIRNAYMCPTAVKFLYSIQEKPEHILTKAVNE